jgi:pSer/pThr/pTyr-binding forkhead associated (FHA) protein
VADRGSLVIGRDGERDLQIPIRGDPCVSRRHGEIMKIGAGWGIRDLGSTNGTRLNGVALAGTEVKRLLPGDIIEMGCYSRLTVQESPGRGVKW